MGLIERLTRELGDGVVATGAAADPWQREWTGKFETAPAAVLRPRSTAEVSRILAAAHDTRTPVVPVSGNTGLNGGTVAAGGAVALSLDRMDAIRAIRPAARVAIVEAGVIMEHLHAAAEAHDLVFPMTFGAKGSARIGGMLSTNCGGSNVLRYGTMRQLCLGLEVVLADGRVMDLMSELHKDNTGYDLRDLMIGAEGTLGIITAAVLRLSPRPRAYATALVAVPEIDAALTLLERVQAETGGAVEACEYMPRSYIDAHIAHVPGARQPFAAAHDHVVMIEIGATAARDATPGPDGSLPVVGLLEEILAGCLEEGLVTDAVLARSEAQRREIWARREAAGEVMFHRKPLLDTDLSLPLNRVAAFFETVRPRVAALDPQATDMAVAHLGDGNVHYTVYPGIGDAGHLDRLREAIEEVTVDLGGSFSAEHGIGLSKLPSMRRHKDPVALAVMRQVKQALDPRGILNPGKVLPPANDPVD